MLPEYFEYVQREKPTTSVFHMKIGKITRQVGMNVNLAVFYTIGREVLGHCSKQT